MSSRLFRKTAGWAATLPLALALGGVAQADDRPDGWITLKAKLALMLADDVDGSDIDVDTVNQRVTLHGAVDSEASKSAAARIVRDVEGVRDVRNLLDVVPERARERHAEMSERADEQLEARLEGMVDRWKRDGVDVEVDSVKDGVVVLDGEVDSLARYADIVARIKRVDGVRHVDSRIDASDELREPAVWRDAKPYAGTRSDDEERDAFSDLWLTTAVKTKLLANGDVPALDINVDTWNGEVTLFGVVGTDAAKKRAETEARTVDGVRNVRNELQVVPKSAAEATEGNDEAIRERIEKAFDGREALDDIEVEVVNGVARLTGEVDSEMRRLTAATLARSVKGVRSVVNDVRLNSAT